MTAREIVEVIERELAVQKITKAQFYKECDISAAMMSNWRNGNNNPSMSVLQRINEFLGLNFAITLEVTEDDKKPAADSSGHISRQSSIDAIQRLTDEDALRLAFWLIERKVAAEDLPKIATKALEQMQKKDGEKEHK